MYLKSSPKCQQLHALGWREAGGYRLSSLPGCLPGATWDAPATEGGGDLESAQLLCKSLQVGSQALGVALSAESVVRDVRG